MTVDVASLALRVDALEVNAASESLKRLQQSGSDAEKGLGKSTDNMATSFRRLGIQAAALYAAFKTISGATTSFNEFDKSLGLISTQLGDATHQVQEFAAASRTLATQFGSNLSTQSGAFFEILSSGITDTTEATEILTEANKLAIGGNADLITTIGGLTSIMKVYEGSVKNAAEVSDSLFTSALAGNISIEELSVGLGRVSGLANNVGVGLDELGSSIAALTLVGVPAREAIVGVRAVLASLVKPSAEAAEEAERLGIAFNADSIKESGGLLKFLEELKIKTGGSTTSLGLLFGGVESLLPILNLTSKAGAEFNQIMEQQANKLGISDKSFQKMADTNEFKMQKFMASVNSAAVTLGGTLASILTPAAELAAAALNKLFNVQQLTGIQKQQQEVDKLTEKIERMRGVNAISPFENFKIFNKKDLDLAEFQLESAKEKLQSLIDIKTEADKPAASVEEPKLVPNNPPKPGKDKKGGGSKKEEISEADRFIASLKEQAEQAGVTGTALLELKATNLGVADSAKPYIETIKGVEAATKAQNEATKASQEELAKVKAIIDDNITAEERLIERQDELAALFNKDALSAEQFGRAMTKATKTYEDSFKTSNDTIKNLEFVIQGFGRRASDTLADFAINGKASFGDFAKSVIKDILSMYIQLKLITPLLQSLPGLGFGGGSSSTSGAGTSAASSVFSNLFKGGRASGGNVSSNSLYRVNERGPELLNVGNEQFLMTNSRNGNVKPIKNSSGGGGQNIVVNLIEAPGSGGETKQRQNASGGVEIDVMVDQIMAKKQNQRGSASNKSLRNNFGLSDNLVTR